MMEVDLVRKHQTCIEQLWAIGGNLATIPMALDYKENDQMRLEALVFVDRQFRWLEYVKNQRGNWDKITTSSEERAQIGGIEIFDNEGINTPPTVMVKSGGITWEIWNPNPQLSGVRLGDVSVYQWKDKTGKTWSGGLYKPPGYRDGQRYPIVIQTHGFRDTQFSPSGIYTTAFAAQALAASGIIVLQLGDACPRVTSDEASCVVDGFDAAVDQLVASGLADRNKIGIVGSSRMCLHVTQALVTGRTHYAAALIADGVMLSYFQYTLSVDSGNEAQEMDQMIGPPFGATLPGWIN